MSERKIANGKKVVIIGLGYVGLPLALLVARNGFETIGLDNDSIKVDTINKGMSPFYDAEINSQLKDCKLKATTDESVIKDASIVIVCVPTPVDSNKKPVLKMLESACKTIAKYITPDALVIIESTINPGVCDTVLIPLLEQGSGMKVGNQIMLAHCPERINPGDPRWSVSNIPRVIGGHDAKSLVAATAFYGRIIAAPLHAMDSIIEAEAVKLTENSFRDINIAFVNELAMSFDKLDIDIVKVIDGAATKPFSFLPHYPGIGVGGHCIPVDPLYLIDHAAKKGFDHKILKLARQTNDMMPRYGVTLLDERAMSLNINMADMKVGVLGLSYKENVGDLRESPALEVINALEEKGVQVATHDPHVSDPIGPEQHTELESILKWADVLFICTAHQEYLGITETSLSNTNVVIVIDGRNCLNKREFSNQKVVYQGVGVR